MKMKKKKSGKNGKLSWGKKYLWIIYTPEYLPRGTWDTVTYKSRNQGSYV